MGHGTFRAKGPILRAGWFKYAAPLLMVAVVAWWPRASDSKLAPRVPPLLLSAADVATVQLQRVGQDVPLSGTLNPLRQATLNARSGGEVAMLMVRAGDSVKAGEVLAVMDTRDMELRARQAKSNLLGNRAEAELAQQKAERLRPLREQNFVSETEMSTAERQVEIRNSQTRSAEAALAQILQQMEDAVIRAPFSGRIAERLVDPGQTVAPGTPLLKVVDLETIELEALAATSDMSLILPGQLVEFRVDGFPGRDFTGHIVRINPVARSGNRRVPVYVQVDNHQGLLLAGGFAKGAALDPHAASGLALPISALQRLGQGWQVFVVEHQQLLARPVQVTLRNDERGLALVQGALKAGDVVLQTPPQPQHLNRPVQLAGAH